MHSFGYYPLAVRSSSRLSEGITLRSSLIRAHASDQIPPTDFGFRLIPWVFAGFVSPCWEMALPDVRTCESFPGCLDLCPGSSQSARTRCFLWDIGLPHLQPMGRLPQNTPPSGFSAGWILGTVIIPYVQASSFACHPDRSHRDGYAGLFFRSRGRSTGSVLWAWTVFRVALHVIRPSGVGGFSIRAERMSLPSHASDMLTVRTGQLTVSGLSPN